MAKTATPTQTDREVLIEAIQSAGDYPSKAQAANALRSVIDGINNLLRDNGTKAGYRLGIHGLGIFQTVAVKAKSGRNPINGAALKIAARTAVKFKLTQALRDLGKAAK